MGTEPRRTFINNFIATFLASYCAEQYDFHCQTGTKHSFPIEDAEFLAEEAWKEYQKRIEGEDSRDGH